MIADARHGRFIAVEGGEGAGKSTVARALAARLRADGFDVVETREPGGTAGAEAVRALLVGGDVDRWGARAETLLLLAARADHVARVIAPALERGAWVVCDRFLHSTLAYQGAGRGLDAATLLSLHDFAAGALRPDLALILDVDPGVARARLAGRADHADRFERAGDAFHARVRAAFAGFAAADPRGCRLIDASGEPDAVTDACSRELAAHHGEGRASE